MRRSRACAGQARNTNHTLIEVAEAVTLSYPLFRLPPPVEHAEAVSERPEGTKDCS